MKFTRVIKRHVYSTAQFPDAYAHVNRLQLHPPLTLAALPEPLRSLVPGSSATGELESAPTHQYR